MLTRISLQTFDASDLAYFCMSCPAVEYSWTFLSGDLFIAVHLLMLCAAIWHDKYTRVQKIYRPVFRDYTGESVPER